MATQPQMSHAPASHPSGGLPVRMERVSVVFPGNRHGGAPDRGREGGGDVAAVQEVSLGVGAGEFVSLLGPSGCGKSTLLRAVAGLQAVTGGAVRVAGQSGKPGEVAFVFQEPSLLPWRNVLRNVELPLELMGVGRAERIAAAERAITQVGLSDAAGRYPGQLSGGMKMRCSLARALVTDPALLLLDEPFAALDEITRHRLDEMLRELWLRRGMTVLFVTHSIPEAVYLSGRAVVFSRRPARIVADRKIALPADRPATIRTDVEFARESRALYESLTSAEAS